LLQHALQVLCLIFEILQLQFFYTHEQYSIYEYLPKYFQKLQVQYLVDVLPNIIRFVLRQALAHKL